MLVNPFTNFAPALAILLLTGKGGVSGGSLGIALVAGILFGSVLPAIYVMRLRQRGEINEWDVQQMDLRLKPLAWGVASYLAGFIALALLGVRGIPLGLMFCYATNTAAVLLITRRWKISIHAIGISGPLVALQMALGPAVYPWWGLAPLVAASRVYLGRHTPAQVVAGVLLGIVMTVVQINLLFL